MLKLFFEKFWHGWELLEIKEVEMLRGKGMCGDDKVRSLNS
jgi:hypothetical protein